MSYRSFCCSGTQVDSSGSSHHPEDCWSLSWKEKRAGGSHIAFPCVTSTSAVGAGSSYTAPPNYRGGDRVRKCSPVTCPEGRGPGAFGKNALMTTTEDFPSFIFLRLRDFCFTPSFCWLTEFYCPSSLA